MPDPAAGRPRALLPANLGLRFLLALQSAVFAVAAVALAAAGRNGLAIAFAVVVAANTVGLQLVGEDGSGARL